MSIATGGQWLSYWMALVPLRGTPPYLSPYIPSPLWGYTDFSCPELNGISWPLLPSSSLSKSRPSFGSLHTALPASPQEGSLSLLCFAYPQGSVCPHLPCILGWSEREGNGAQPSGVDRPRFESGSAAASLGWSCNLLGPWFPTLSSGSHSIYISGWWEDEVGSLSLLFPFLLLYLLLL